jgi:PAS domain S-box-containing protein
MTQDKLRILELEQMLEDRTRDLEKVRDQLRMQIEESERLEEELLASETRYLRLFEKTPAILHSVDRDARIVSVSDYWVENLGYERSEVIGRPVTDFMTEQSRRAAQEENLPKFFQTGSLRDVPYQLVSKNGQLVDVLLSATAERDACGDVVRSLGVACDVTERKRSEEAILRAAEEWESTFDAVPDLIMILDGEHRIVRVNQATVDKLGHSKDELVGSHCYTLFHGTTGPPAFCPCHALHGDARAYDVEVFEPVLGGTFHVTVTPVRDSSGGLLGFVHVARDVSDYKRIQNELAEKLRETKRANDESQALLKCSQALLECDDFQSASHRIFDASKEVIGATAGFLALLSPNHTVFQFQYLDSGNGSCGVDPNLPMPVRGLRAEALLKQDIVYQNDFEESEHNSHIPDGHIPVSNVMFAPLLVSARTVGHLALANKPGGFDDADLQLARAFAEFAVIGLLKCQTEEALRESEAKFRQIAENIEEAFWLTVPGKLEHMAYVSPAFERLWGSEATTFLNNPAAWPSSIHPDDREQALDAYRLFTQGLSGYAVEYRIVRPDGSLRWIWDRGFPIRNGEGDVYRVAGVAQDITQRKAYEHKQRQLMDEVRHFAYIISHDLRAPLINLRGFCRELEAATGVIGDIAEQAHESLPPDRRDSLRMALDDASESIEFIKSSVSRMGRLIEAILKLSRLGHMDLSPQQLDMNEVVHETLNSLAHQINQKGIEVAVGMLPTVYADRTSMDQIVANLLDNAIKYLDPGRAGRIEIDGWSSVDEEVMVISDNGIGIAEKNLDAVFQIFQRAGTVDVPGEGMGLAYVRTLVRRHGGRIWCDSVPGKGSSFTFTIAKNLGMEKHAERSEAACSCSSQEGAHHG